MDSDAALAYVSVPAASTTAMRSGEARRSAASRPPESESPQRSSPVATAFDVTPTRISSRPACVVGVIDGGREALDGGRPGRASAAQLCAPRHDRSDPLCNGSGQSQELSSGVKFPDSPESPETPRRPADQFPGTTKPSARRDGVAMSNDQADGDKLLTPAEVAAMFRVNAK